MSFVCKNYINEYFFHVQVPMFGIFLRGCGSALRQRRAAISHVWTSKNLKKIVPFHGSVAASSLSFDQPPLPAQSSVASITLHHLAWRRCHKASYSSVLGLDSFRHQDLALLRLSSATTSATTPATTSTTTAEATTSKIHGL